MRDQRKPRARGRFVIDRTASGKYWFSLKSANGEIIATSEIYESRSACENGIAAVQSIAGKSEIVYAAPRES